MTEKGARVDIQALRGIAVLLVVSYHADIGLLHAGYLGVDIFFVISGFLITGIICRDIDAGNFSFVGFYKRRARRLLPASLVTFAITSVAACLLLTKLELYSYAEQVIGAVTFTANFVLAAQSNYFDTSAAMKPLLHTWSLSLEEQFYFVAPLALWLTPARFRLALICTLLAASLTACIVLVQRSPDWAFYLLPTRAWELLIGSLIAARPSFRLPRSASALAIVAIFAIAVYPTGAVHPGLDSVIVCTATALLIVARTTFLNSGPAAGSLAAVGNISYSLYLVHWPVFAFTRHAYLGELPLVPALLCAALSFALAIALYRWIESPIHRGKMRLPQPLILGAASVVAIIATPIGYAAAMRSDLDWAEIRKPNVGLASYCHEMPPLKSCFTRDDPEIAVWGDSFAMQLVDGLIAEDHDPKHGILQLTLSACPPVLSLAPDDPKALESCVAFNKSALSFLEKSNVKYVVLSAASRYGRLEPTFHALQDAGKSVVLVGPAPESKTDKSICVERHAAFIRKSDCAITRKDFPTLYVNHIDEIKRLEQKGVRVIRLTAALCKDGQCATHYRGMPLYRDTSHLSTFGSVEVAKRIHLLDQIVSPQEARVSLRP